MAIRSALRLVARFRIRISDVIACFVTHTFWNDALALIRHLAFKEMQPRFRGPSGTDGVVSRGVLVFQKGFIKAHLLSTLLEQP
jgi:hypothetical protein